MTRKVFALIAIFVVAVLFYAHENKATATEAQADVARLQSEVKALQTQVAQQTENEKALVHVLAQHARAIDQVAGHHVALCVTRGSDGKITAVGNCPTGQGQ